MDRNNILSLLGLSLRGGRLAVGEEPVEAAARARDARLLLLAADAAENTRRRVERFAETGQCLWIQLPFTKAELGRAVGRTSVAVTALTDIGLANALAGKLVRLDPERYGAAAERLELKARRAAQRQEEQRSHQRNLRTGKRREKKPGRGSPPAARPAAGPKEGAEEAGGARRSQRDAGPGRGRRGPSEAAPRKNRSPAPPRGSGGGRGETRGGGKPRPYAHSRPVKKGKGSFRKREDGRS